MLLAHLFRLTDGLSLGLLLIGMSAGAPFLPRLVELARGNVALGVAVMTLLLVTTVGYVPLVLPWFAPGVAVQPWAIAKPILLLMLAPLVASMAIRVWRPRLPGRLGPLLQWISRVAMGVLLVLLLAFNLERVRSVVGSGALAAAGLFVLAALGHRLLHRGRLGPTSARAEPGHGAARHLGRTADRDARRPGPGCVGDGGGDPGRGAAPVFLGRCPGPLVLGRHLSQCRRHDERGRDREQRPCGKGT